MPKEESVDPNPRRSPVEPRVETKVPLAADDGDGEEEDDTVPRCGGCRRGMKNGPVTSTELYRNIFIVSKYFLGRRSR